MHTTPSVDGAVHPELIPDDLALSVWLLAVGETSTANPDAVSRMRAKLTAVVLSPDDQLILRKAVVHFADVRDSFRIREEGFTDTSTIKGQQQREQLITDQRSLFLEVKQSMITTLSREGQQSLKQHLLRVKQHMRVGQGPQM